MDFLNSVQGEQKRFSPNTAQVFICRRQKVQSRVGKQHPGGHEKQIFTMKGRGEAACSKLFHQVIGGRANVSFGRLTVKVCQKQKQ